MKTTIKVKECHLIYFAKGEEKHSITCDCQGSGYLRQDGSPLPKIGDVKKICLIHMSILENIKFTPYGVPQGSLSYTCMKGLHHPKDWQELKLKSISSIDKKKMEAVLEWE